MGEEEGGGRREGGEGGRGGREAATPWSRQFSYIVSYLLGVHHSALVHVQLPHPDTEEERGVAIIQDGGGQWLPYLGS